MSAFSVSLIVCSLLSFLSCIHKPCPLQMFPPEDTRPSMVVGTTSLRCEGSLRFLATTVIWLSSGLSSTGIGGIGGKAQPTAQPRPSHLQPAIASPNQEIRPGHPPADELINALANYKCIQGAFGVCFSRADEAQTRATNTARAKGQSSMPHADGGGQRVLRFRRFYVSCLPESLVDPLIAATN